MCALLDIDNSLQRSLVSIFSLDRGSKDNLADVSVFKPVFRTLSITLV